MPTILQDLRFSWRLLARRPAVSWTTVLTLALGIAACTGVFSVVSSVLIAPLPYPEPDELVTLWETHPRQGSAFRVSSLSTALAWRDQLAELEGLAISQPWRPVLSSGGELYSLQGAKVSAEFFQLLGITPMLGRGFSADDDRPGAEPVVLLGHGLWRQRFGGDAGLVGRTVQLEGRRQGQIATVIGILPPDLRIADPLVFEQAEIWAPLALHPSQVHQGQRYFRAFGRLAEASDLAAARARLGSISVELESRYPATHQEWQGAMETLSEEIAAPLRPALLALLAGVGLVFLAACCNTGILLLSQATDRRQEIAVRLAVGASPRRIGWQIFNESCWLAGLSLVIGVALASRGLTLARPYTFSHLSSFHDVSLDARVLLFASGLALLTVLLFGLIPALRTVRGDYFAHLRLLPLKGGSAATSLRKWLMASEVALSLVLLTVATLMLESFERLTTADPGFDARGVVTMRVRLPGSLHPDAAERDALYRRLLADVVALSRVESAGLVDHLPMAGSNMATQAAAGEARERSIQVELRGVTGGYFEALGIPVEGAPEVPEWDSKSTARVAFLSRAAAERLWPGGDAAGRQLFLDWGSGEAIEVAGVVGDIRHHGMWSEARPTVYLPFHQLPHRALNLVVRSEPKPSMTADVQARARALDPAFVLENVQPLARIVDATIAEPRGRAMMSASFALITLILAAGGTYSVVAYSVAQRRYDFSIRQALGAHPRKLLQGTLADGARQISAGIAIGLAASLILSRALSGLLYGISAHHPGTLLGSTLLMSAVVFLATYVPASRVMKTNPAVDLRAA